MKRTTAYAVAIAAVALMARGDPARAGEYHTGVNLKCAECHTMHYSETHDYGGVDGSGGPTSNPVQAIMGTSGPYAGLLRNDPNDLCASCHNGQTFAPDVIGANSNSYVREAGALPTGAAPYDAWKGHSLGSTAVAPGGTFSNPEGLECLDCHHQHGFAGQGKDAAGNTVSSSYRNLTGRLNSVLGYNVTVSYAKGTNDTTKDVFLRSWTLGDLANNYSVDNVDLNEPDATKSGIGQWCQTCHTDFHGKKGDPNMGGNGGTSGSWDWLRHPTANIDIGQQSAEGHSNLTTFKNRLYRVKVMSPTGQWGTQGTAWAGATNDLTPTCLSCHKAHGNQNPFGLIYLAGTGPVTEEGDADGNAAADAGGGVRKLCKQCHGQGGTI